MHRAWVASVLTKLTTGESIEVGMIGMEGMIGLSALFGDEMSAQHVLMQAPVTALRMDASKCIAAFDQSADVRAVVLRYTQTAACNRLHSLKEHAARWLLMMYDSLRSDDMPLTHEFLSSMLGTRRTRVTETAGELQRMGSFATRETWSRFSITPDYRRQRASAIGPMIA